MRSKQNLFSQLDEEDEIQEEDGEQSSESRFKKNFNNLDDDITHIELKLQGIDTHVKVLEIKINNLDNLINQVQQTPNSNIDISKLYMSYTKSYELLSFMQKSYQVYLDLKFKYRVEQDDLRFKLHRMDEIEKKKINELDEINSADIVSALSKFMTTPGKQETALKEVLDNPKYSI
jgi:hypothetical protein